MSDLPRECDGAVLALELCERAGTEADVREQQLPHEPGVAPRLCAEVREGLVGRRENRHALLGEELRQLVRETAEGKGVTDGGKARGTRAPQEFCGGVGSGVGGGRCAGMVLSATW